ncbi:sugar ABC transporter substrate-binding protein [Streptomyces mirabilis]|uniref:sugar ABC transporter substrate-binding protein n=1 Tax=Streptomyces mirabilis TaxID=68239 RepID=UPI0036C2F2F8
MKRIIWSTAVAATGALTLTACGGSSSGSGSTPAKADDSKQTLTVWAMGDEGKELGALAKKFTAANPNITVAVTPIDWGVAHDKLIAAMTGDGPDVTQMGTTLMGEFAQTGGLDEIPAGVVDKSQFSDGAWSTGQVDGKTYGVPWYVETRVLYYRSDLFAKAGISHGPATWDELNADAAKLKAGGAKYGISVQPGQDGSWQQMLPFVWSTGGDLFDASGRAAANTDAFKQGLTEYQSFFKAGQAAKSVPKGYDVTKDFATGDVPMFFSGPWIAGGLKKDHPELNGKWGIVRMPAKTSSTSFLGGADLAILKSSKHKAAAQKFVAWLSSAQTQVDFFKASGDLPANKSAWTDPAITADPDNKVFTAQLANAKSPMPTAQWDEIAAKVDAWVEKLCQGAATVDQTAAGIQADVTSVLGS